MPDKFKNKYRIESHRMPGWDYSGNGSYFITMVVQNWECLLGEIKNHKMILADYGKIVKTEWVKSFEIRAELFCDEYIVMPNHLHAIVVINKSDNKTNVDDGSHVYDGSHVDDGSRVYDGSHVDNGSHVDDDSHVDNGSHVETHGRASLRANHPQHPQHPFHRKPKSLSSFIAGFKSATNTKIDDYIDNHQLNIPKYNKNNHFWQPNYHDRVIRNQQEYNRIKQYIINNPKNWTGDKFNPNNG